MKTASLTLLILYLSYPSIVAGMSSDEVVTPESINTFPLFLSVETSDQPNEMVAYTIKLTIRDLRYVSQHLVVRDVEQILSEHRTPVFAKNQTVAYCFSIPRKVVGTSTFTVSVCNAMERKGRPTIAIPGTTNFIFRLSEFTPSELSK
jgi:hypothetical protein